MDNLWVPCEKGPRFSPWGASWAQETCIRAARSAVFLKKIQNGGRRFTLDWIECLSWFAPSQFFFFPSKFNVRCFLTRLTMLESTSNLVYWTHFLGAATPKVFVFWATFEQLSLHKATFDFFWATFEKLFEKLLETFEEISSNLWKALMIISRNYIVS